MAFKLMTVIDGKRDLACYILELEGSCYGFRYRTMRSHAQVTTIDTLIVVNETKSPNTHHLCIC
jgi:hypothetical protein